MTHVIEKFIMKRTRDNLVVKICGTGTMVIPIDDAIHFDEVLDRPNVKLPIATVYHNNKHDFTIKRGNVDILEFTAEKNGILRFTKDFGCNLQERANANVSITLDNGNNMVILEFSKEAGYITPNYQILYPQDK